jgi:hypothetical protein
VVAWRVLACKRSFEVALKDEIARDSRREGETMVKRDKTRGVTRDTSTINKDKHYRNPHKKVVAHCSQGQSLSKKKNSIIEYKLLTAKFIIFQPVKT